MQTTIKNYINGNLHDARVGALNLSWRKIFKYLRQELGWSENRAMAVADYLKGYGSFQATCDADYQTRGLSAPGAALLNQIDGRRNL